MTVLAFIFVPVSLASSIFGMNVQQINNSGHGIAVFFLTSAALLVLPGIVFHCRRAIGSAFMELVSLLRWRLSGPIETFMAVVSVSWNVIRGRPPASDIRWETDPLPIGHPLSS